MGGVYADTDLSIISEQISETLFPCWVTQQINNTISLFPQNLHPPNLMLWWLRVRGSHLPNHMSLSSFSHVISRDKMKTLYLHFYKTYKHQIWHGSDLVLGSSFYQVTCFFNYMIMWCNKQNKKTFYLHFKLPTWRS